MNNRVTPIKYVLYSHYGCNEMEDFNAFKEGEQPQDLCGVKHFLIHLRGLRELLTSPGHEGLLVLFYSPGYERFLKSLARGEDDSQLLLMAHDDDDCMRLKMAKDVADYVRERLQKEGLTERIRFLTSFDLRVILGRVNAIFAGQFSQFFVGPASGIRYDSPKVVEAILRLRVLGNGVPVLRLDHDVIFRGVNHAIGDLGLFKAVTCAVRAYKLRLEEPTVSTFLFSASYNSRALLNPPDDMDSFEAWSRAFATRIYPALRANVKEIQRICKLPVDTDKQKKHQDTEWNDYVKKHIDERFALQFYGLDEFVQESKRELKVEGTKGLASVGAHPLFSVISGALLCLSEGAILDLPPFSNLGINVMWIDDHLKYSLHRAMNHFTSSETLNLEPGLSDARLDDVTVTKARPPVGCLHTYIFDNYLPTLLWGAIVDAWITVDPILKCRVANLSDKEQEKWRKARSEQHKAPLPAAMLEALRVGNFDPESERQLRETMKGIAIQRINEVRQIWSKLREDECGTFASYWAMGTVDSVFGEDCFKDCEDRLWLGIAPGHPLDIPLKSLDDLTTPMALKVDSLINDTIAYVHWTLEWPQFVQIVRSIGQGEFPGDLRWKPKRSYNVNIR